MGTLSVLCKPGLNAPYSRQILTGALHRQRYGEARRAWPSNPGTVRRALLVGDAGARLVATTGYGAIAAADRIVAPAVNLVAGLAAALAAGLACAGWAALRPVWPTAKEASLADAARLGAACGYEFVRGAYQVALRVAMLACNVAVAPLQWLTQGISAATKIGLQAAPPPARSDFVPLPMAAVPALLEGLDGQGGALASFEHVAWTANEGASGGRFVGNLQHGFGVLSRTAFVGTVACKHGVASEITLVATSAPGAAPVSFRFRPSLLHGRLHMTGTGEGMKYYPHGPGDALVDLGYKVKRKRRAEQEEGRPGAFVGFCRFGAGARARAVQYFYFDGLDAPALARGHVTYRRVPFATVAAVCFGAVLDA